ncbi:MAG TPA: peptidoglycan DD-metalloendopeptidase family protein [Archangium sp.]
MTALLLAFVLAAGSDVEDEHAQLEARLAAEKTAFEAIGDEKKDLLSLLDTLERLARESSQRTQALERNVARVARQVGEAKQEAERSQVELVAQQRAIAPRLFKLYRIQKQDSLASLLSAGDFAALIKRQRAMETLVQADVRDLDELAVFAQWQKRRAKRLERLEATGQRYLRALRSEQAVGQARLTRFKDLLASVTAEQNRMSRVIAELEQTEKELAGMVTDLQSTVGSSGFRARKGQLPFPAKGIVEVGFGKVVNPRFNTVTVQKGIDIRAGEGSEVRTIGSGTVVFSGWLKGYGNLVIVDHGSAYHSLYAHLANSQVEVGNQVEEGEAIGQVGDTGSLKGPFLYFEIRKAGQAVDPLPWLKPEE